MAHRITVVACALFVLGCGPRMQSVIVPPEHVAVHCDQRRCDPEILIPGEHRIPVASRLRAVSCAPFFVREQEHVVRTYEDVRVRVAYDATLIRNCADEAVLRDLLFEGEPRSDDDFFATLGRPLIEVSADKGVWRIDAASISRFPETVGQVISAEIDRRQRHGLEPLLVDVAVTRVWISCDGPAVRAECNVDALGRWWRRVYARMRLDGK